MDRVVEKAMHRAAALLGVDDEALEKIVGDDHELAVQFIRMFRAIDTITGGDMHSVRSWMQSENLALGGRQLYEQVACLRWV